MSSFPAKIIYSKEEFKHWKLLFEKFGSFKKVSSYLKNSDLRYAAHQTIRKNIKEYFLELGLNYQEWYDKHKLDSPFSHRYNDNDLSEWKAIFEGIGTLSGVSKFLKKRDGKTPKPTTIKEAIKRKFEKERIDFKIWYHKFHKKPTSIIPYSEQDENLWEQLFEQLGSFRAAERYIKERYNGKGPSYITIIKHLQRKFERENRDFDRWLKHYHIKYTDIKGYSEEDVKEWEDLFEKFGKIKDVIKYIEEEYGISPDKKTIMRHLKQKFKNENRNFVVWYKNNDKSNIHWYYTPEQIQIMIQLYEEYGAFEAVQDQLESEYDIQIHPSTIKNNFVKYFKLNKLNFKSWLKTYDRVYYYEQEVSRWEILYQRIGSFIGVFRYLRNLTNKAPSPSTIERRLRSKFLRENRDFNKFKKKHFQEYHESLAREFLKRIFGVDFSKVRPVWLVNPETGKRLELDGYSKLLKIAFEYNGPQHYEYFERYHKSIQDYYDQLIRDEYKKKICEENDIILIIIPYDVKPAEMQDFIINAYYRLTGAYLRQFYREKMAEKCQNLIITISFIKKV